ncbi:hypothetical protein MTO96_019038 [Rhipicephalus appendiculatus]
MSKGFAAFRKEPQGGLHPLSVEDELLTAEVEDDTMPSTTRPLEAVSMMAGRRRMRNPLLLNQEVVEQSISHLGLEDDRDDDPAIKSYSKSTTSPWPIERGGRPCSFTTTAGDAATFWRFAKDRHHLDTQGTPPLKFCPSLFLGDRPCLPMCTRWKNSSGTCCILVAAIQCLLGEVRAGLLATLSTRRPDTLVGALLPVTGDRQSTAREEHCLLPLEPRSTVSAQADHRTHRHHPVVCPHCLASLVCRPLPGHQDLSTAACHREIIHLDSEADCPCLLCPIPC